MTHDDALPALPIGEAEVLWHEPDPVMPERPGKIIDASHAFMDAAPLGTRLYSAEQMRAYVRTALAARAEPVAWQWQHDETGRVGFVDPWQVENGWQANNPRCRIIRPLYAAPPALPQGDARAEPVWAADGWRQECDDADAVLRLIGLDPEQCRTDGGSLNVPKIGSLLRDRATALAYLCPAGCGCTWRDNGDGSMSLYGPSSRSCAVCETMPLSKLLPVYTAPAQPASAEQQPVAWFSPEQKRAMAIIQSAAKALEEGTFTAPPAHTPCPHIRSSGTGDHATNWCALAEQPALHEAARRRGWRWMRWRKAATT